LLEAKSSIPPVREREGFRLSGEQIEEAISDRTKMMIPNSPNNPAGSVLGRDDLESIAEVTKRRRILVLSDEVYEKIIYENKHYSIASFPVMEDRVITISSFSRTMAMTGWRLGYLAGPRDIVRHIKSTHSHMVTGPCTFAQRAAALALGDSRTSESISGMLLEYSKRRDLANRELRNVEGISCMKPQATFSCFASITKLGLSSEKVTRELLEKAGVAVVSGNAFGRGGEGFIRLSFATSTDSLTVALERIRNTISQVRAK
jgi:aspartate/methionine/tyrosine aminotransferase